MRRTSGASRGLLALAPLMLLVAVGLSSCAQIMRDDSGGRAGGSAATTSTPRSSAPVYYYTYYVSPSGSDSAAGTSPSTAWRTLSKASSMILRPGTRVLLQGGQRFTGELRLGRRDAGSAAHPVLIGSYGRGRATIVERKADAISIDNTAGVVIRDLSLVGRGRAFTYGLGVDAYSSRTGTNRLDGLVISDVSISGFVDGISIGGTGAAGFRDVLVSDCTLDHNLDNGMMTWGPTFDPAKRTYANANIDVQRVTAFANKGDPHLTAHNSGSGIILGSVSGGDVTRSTAYDNGGNEGSREGSDGIWAYDSTQVTLEHSLSYDNRTNDGEDGDGFGLDQNASHSVMQYDLSYGNDGAGYLLYSSLNNGAQTHNVVRFNISSGDVRDGSSLYGGVTVVGHVAHGAVYQNTVVMAPHATGTTPALVLGPLVKGITVRNNIFLIRDGAVVDAQVSLTRAQALLQGNDYYAVAAPVTIIWGPAVYSSVGSWRSATGQEMVHGHPAGLSADPGLRGPVIGLRARSPGVPAVGRGFAPRRASPLVGAGLDLPRLFGLDPGPENYAGQPVSAANLNVGAV